MKNIYFVLCIILSLLLPFIPRVNVPFLWLTTYFHEISQAITTILTGGKAIKFDLYMNGLGNCITQGGVTFLILFLGYIGVVIWGILIFLLGSRVSKQTFFGY